MDKDRWMHIGRDAIRMHLWREAAARRYDMEGLTRVSRKAVDLLVHPDREPLRRTLMAGAAWTRARHHVAGGVLSPACPRCGAARETLTHVLWECQAWNEVRRGIGFNDDAVTAIRTKLPACVTLCCLPIEDDLLKAHGWLLMRKIIDMCTLILQKRTAEEILSRCEPPWVKRNVYRCWSGADTDDDADGPGDRGGGGGPGAPGSANGGSGARPRPAPMTRTRRRSDPSPSLARAPLSGGPGCRPPAAVGAVCGGRLAGGGCGGADVAVLVSSEDDAPPPKRSRGPPVKSDAPGDVQPVRVVRPRVAY